MTLSPVHPVTRPNIRKKNGKEIELPFRFTAVDMGSNSIKVRISEILNPGNHQTLWENKYPVRLGHETFLTGKLDRDMIKDAITVLAKIKFIGRKYKVDTISAVATSAVREASNRRQLIAQAVKKTGIEIEIISGAEEARLIALGVLGELPIKQQDYLLIDIGGGSAEITYSNDYTIIDTQSLPLGAVRLKEQYMKSDPISSDDYDLLHDHIRLVIKNHLRIKSIPQNVVTIGSAGTISALVQMHNNDKSNGKKKTNITLHQINELISQLCKSKIKQSMKKFGLEKRRAEIIIPGAMVLAEVMKELNIHSLELSTHGLRDGLLQDFLERHGLKPDLVFDHDRAFLQSLSSLVDRYGSDRKHVVQVCGLALNLFDELRSLHGFGPQEKNILKGAAFLHDIGQFISYTKHHKHAYYLITHSDIPGISERDKLLIATIARFHRRALPNMEQEEYRILSNDERIIVRKLAGILRIADAFDKEHLSLVSSLDCQIKNGKVTIIVTPARPIPVELYAAKKKAELFESSFHCKTTFKVLV